MALQTKTVPINGRTYEITQLPYTKGKSVLLRLLKILGPSVGAALERFPALKEKELASLQVGEIAGALSAALERLTADLSEEDFDFVADALAEYTHLLQDGKKLKLKNEREFLFAGNYLEMFQWLTAAIRHNFLGFFDGRDAIAEALARAEALGASRSRQA